MNKLSDYDLKLVAGGFSAALINALARGATTILGIGQIVGTALRKLLKR